MAYLALQAWWWVFGCTAQSLKQNPEQILDYFGVGYYQVFQFDIAFQGLS